jgi:hypothetical protein
MSGELRNRWASFRIQDVFIPDPEKLLVDLYGHNVLQGKIVDLSEGGPGGDMFVVVEVLGIDQPLIVPLARVLSVV